MEQLINPIWKNFNASLEQLVCRKTNHQEHCQDILQDVYIKIIHNIDKVEKAKNIKSYLLKIADNTVTDYYRGKNNIATAFEDFHEIETLEPAVDENLLQLADCCLRPMIESLEPIYREALILTELEGLSQRQLADKIGISLSGAKSRVQRAKEKLKEVILNCCSYEFDKYGNIISCVKNPSGCCG